MITLQHTADGHWFPVRTLLLSGGGYRFSPDGSILTVNDPRATPASFDRVNAWITDHGALNYPLPGPLLGGTKDGSVPLRPLGTINVVGVPYPLAWYLVGGLAIPYLGITTSFGTLPQDRAVVTDMGDSRAEYHLDSGQAHGLPVILVGAATYTLASSGSFQGFRSAPRPPPPDGSTLAWPDPPGRVDWPGSSIASGKLGAATPITASAGRSLYYRFKGPDLTWFYDIGTRFSVFTFALPPGESLTSFYGIGHLTLALQSADWAEYLFTGNPDFPPSGSAIGSAGVSLAWGWDTYDPNDSSTANRSAYAQIISGGGTVIGPAGTSNDLSAICDQAAPNPPNFVLPKLWVAMYPDPIQKDGFPGGGAWTRVFTGPDGYGFYFDLADQTQTFFHGPQFTASA